MDIHEFRKQENLIISHKKLLITLLKELDYVDENNINDALFEGLTEILTNLMHESKTNMLASVRKTLFPDISPANQDKSNEEFDEGLSKMMGFNINQLENITLKK